MVPGFGRYQSRGPPTRTIRLGHPRRPSARTIRLAHQRGPSAPIICATLSHGMDSVVVVVVAVAVMVGRIRETDLRLQAGWRSGLGRRRRHKPGSVTVVSVVISSRVHVSIPFTHGHWRVVERDSVTAARVTWFAPAKAPSWRSSRLARPAAGSQA